MSKESKHGRPLDQKAKLTSYWRLLAYVKPYKWRLVVGIAAG